MVKEADREREQIEEAQVRRQERLNRRIGDSFADMFGDAITGAQSLKESIADLALDLGKLAISNGFQTLLSNTGGGGFFSSIASIFGGARAMGGPVSAGQAYLVGERGPEIFAPGRNGTIIPNGGEAGHTFSPTITLNVGAGADKAAVAQGFAALQRQIEDMRATFRDNVAAANRNPRFRSSV